MDNLRPRPKMQFLKPACICDDIPLLDVKKSITDSQYHLVAHWPVLKGLGSCRMESQNAYKRITTRGISVQLSNRLHYFEIEAQLGYIVHRTTNR